MPDGDFLLLLIHIIKYKTYKVLFNGIESDEFQVEHGVPRGDSLSPTLFCIYMNDFLMELDRNINKIDPINISNLNLAALIYADDILLMSETQTGIITQIKLLHKYCESNSLKINYNKTKIMIFNETEKYEKLHLNDEDDILPIEVVNEYKYLGYWITKNDRKHIEELTKKGKASSYVNAKMLKEFDNVDGRILTEAFEMLTISKIRYGGELFFDKNLADLKERSHLHDNYICLLMIFLFFQQRSFIRQNSAFA